MSKWVGYAVSVNCGEPLGCYQGTILQADGTTITLTKPFRNGFPYPKSQVTLNAADIKDLKIIELRSERTEQTHSTVAVTKNNKKGQRATVCETLQANPSSSGGNVVNVGTGSNNKVSARGSCSGPARSKPIDIQGNRNKNSSHSGSYGQQGSTPRGRAGASARRRNEAFFGDTADPALHDDFDFEGNLALFDKQALWEEMRNSHKPDVVRGADRFRHDENVLGPAPAGAERRLIRLPAELRGARDYVTDDGIVVPTAVPALRHAIWEAMQRYGLLEAAYTLLARAAADVALRLVGGGRRLDPRNAHQAPTVVALVGAHPTGAAGLLAARLLSSQGARVVYSVAGAGGCGELALEERALQLDGAEAGALGALPNPDLVLLALHDARAARPAPPPRDALAWAGAARGAVLALEPPAEGWPGVSARAAVVGALPPALPAELGRLYLADLGVPRAVLSELRASYRPPFAAASVLALHPNDD